METIIDIQPWKSPWKENTEEKWHTWTTSRWRVLNCNKNKETQRSCSATEMQTTRAGASRGSPCAETRTKTRTPTPNTASATAPSKAENTINCLKQNSATKKSPKQPRSKAGEQTETCCPLLEAALEEPERTSGALWSSPLISGECKIEASSL